MKKSTRNPYCCFLLASCFFLSLFCAACAPKNTGWKSSPLQIEVIATGSNALITVFAPTETGRVELLRSSGFVGKGGVTGNKQEGDGKTPLGIYSIERTFGLLNSPNKNMPYTKIKNFDVWVDDPKSRYYNQWAYDNAPDKDWNSAEGLINETEAYKYAAIIEYNTKDTVKGAGSAIFIHCSKGVPTAGCVSLPEANMRKLLQLLVHGAKIAIARSPYEMRKITQ